MRSAAALVIGLLVAAVLPARAATVTFNVDDASEAPDSNTADGVCHTASNTCTSGPPSSRLTLLTGLPPASGMPDVGEALWSTSGSPFAPETRVRAVACDGSARFIIVLLERTARARWWGVWRRASTRD